MVDLALSSMALAIFARAQNHAPAAMEASKSYCNALNIAQEKITGLTKSALDECDIDSCLLAVSLMSRYELAAHHFGVFDSSIQSCSHYGGAVAILKVWNNKLQKKTPTFIIRHTRKELIKSAIIRGRRVPDWLLDGTRFGEQEDALAYDHIVARLSKLRFDFKCLRNSHPQIELAQQLDAEAQELDDISQKWASLVPFTCSPVRHIITCSDGFPLPRKHFYSDVAYSYPKYGNSAAWCQYYAVRMLINSILLGILDMRREVLMPCDYGRRRINCLAHVRAMGGSIAASIPFCLEKLRIQENCSDGQSSVTLITDENVKPHSASLLAWPLTIASTIAELDHGQRVWFTSELAALGKVIGDGILEGAETGRLAIA